MLKAPTRCMTPRPHQIPGRRCRSESPNDHRSGLCDAPGRPRIDQSCSAGSWPEYRRSRRREASNAPRTGARRAGLRPWHERDETRHGPKQPEASGRPRPTSQRDTASHHRRPPRRPTEPATTAAARNPWLLAQNRLLPPETGTQQPALAQGPGAFLNSRTACSHTHSMSPPFQRGHMCECELRITVATHKDDGVSLPRVLRRKHQPMWDRQCILTPTCAVRQLLVPPALRSVNLSRNGMWKTRCNLAASCRHSRS